MSFFDELKKRNVFRVGFAYLVSAWVIAQVASLIFDSIKAPDWVMQSLLLLMGLGFIVALVVAWAYELTPEGIKREKDVVRDDSVTNITARKLNYITLAAAVAVVALIGWQQLNPRTEPGVGVQVDDADSVDLNEGHSLKEEDLLTRKEKSIAVLPFVDMSQAGDQEYFADGIAEEILNVLVRIPELKVAGRTSSFSFKGKNEDLRTIGNSLGVNHILEGSVRRSNARLRITAQLIRSDDGFHLWSETYDREIADIFDIQDEIAQQVADQLVISMGLKVKTTEQNRTADLAVYEGYLKAKKLFLQRGRENLDQSLELLNEATSTDPNYAPAWTLKAYIYSIYGAYVSQGERRATMKERNDLRKAAAERALSLDPQSAEAYAVLGSVYFDNFDFIPGIENYERAVALSPDNPVVLDNAAQNFVSVGYFERARQLSEKAVRIDPLVAIYRNTLGLVNVFLGDEKKAIENFEKSIELDPLLKFPYDNLQWLYLNPDDFEKFRSVIDLRIRNGLPTTGIQSALALVENEALLSDRDALISLARGPSNSGTTWLATAYLNDAEILVENLERSLWRPENRESAGSLFLSWQRPVMYGFKRWKEQVRRNGVLALWQAKGFPEHCSPVGTDDFECQ